MKKSMSKSLLGSVLLLASLPVLAHGDGEHMSGILAKMLHLATDADHLLIYTVLVGLGSLAAWALQKPVLRAVGLGTSLAGTVMLLGSV